MEYSMRDLERLQEQDPDERGRHVGMWVVVGLVILLVFAGVVSVLNRGQRPGSNEPDPIDQLMRAQTKRLPEAGTQMKAAVDPTSLTFQESLTDEEERPEVRAALAAAEREEDALAGAQNGEASARRPQPATMAAQLPAGLAASAGGSKLDQAARHDRATTAPGSKPNAATVRTGGGADGEYILHIISYGARDEAERFAGTLRERGHAAFVESGQVDGRPRTFRVRLGPFKTKAAADAYRRDFEVREHMNTIVVRRQDEE
jgi:cell division septation protein DedD